MRRSPVVGNLFSDRRSLPSAMFTGRALAKQCVPHPVNPVNPENPDSDSYGRIVSPPVIGLWARASGLKSLPQDCRTAAEHRCPIRSA